MIWEPVFQSCQKIWGWWWISGTFLVFSSLIQWTVMYFPVLCLLRITKCMSGHRITITQELFHGTWWHAGMHFTGCHLRVKCTICIWRAGWERKRMENMRNIGKASGFPFSCRMPFSRKHRKVTWVRRKELIFGRELGMRMANWWKWKPLKRV